MATPYREMLEDLAETAAERTLARMPRPVSETQRRQALACARRHVVQTWAADNPHYLRGLHAELRAAHGPITPAAVTTHAYA